MIELYTKVGSRLLKHDDDPFMQFPDGEWHMKAEDNTYTGKEIAFVRGTDVNDYIKLALWCDVVRDQTGIPHAVIPYLPAARADRGTPLGARVYTDLIATANDLSSVTFLDIHSEAARTIAFDRFNRPYEYDAASVVNANLDEFDKNYAGVIAPDKGAVDRAAAVAYVLDVPVYEAAKVRDFQTGKLTGFDCAQLNDPTGRYLVVDDICSNGGTFIGLANHLHQKYSKSSTNRVHLELFVSHGGFTNGTAPLLTNGISWGYDRLITTNSLGKTRMSTTALNVNKLLTGHL